MIKHILLVGLGGGVGSILRYLTSIFLLKHYSSSFPLTTFIVNISGCLLMGILFGLAGRHALLHGDLKLLLMVGFCGGYTTFSAFSMENIQLLESGNYFLLAIYTLASVLLGIAAVWFGSWIVK